MKVTCKKCSKDFPYEKYNGVSRSQDSKTIIADARLKTEQKNPEIYEYELLLENHRSKRALFSVYVENQDEDLLSSNIIGVYREAEDWEKKLILR